MFQFYRNQLSKLILSDIFQVLDPVSATLHDPLFNFSVHSFCSTLNSMLFGQPRAHELTKGHQCTVRMPDRRLLRDEQSKGQTYMYGGPNRTNMPPVEGWTSGGENTDMWPHIRTLFSSDRCLCCGGDARLCSNMASFVNSSLRIEVAHGLKCRH